MRPNYYSIMFDANLRNKLCEFMSIESLLMLKNLNNEWKYSVESFMLNKLINNFGIQCLFLMQFSSCDICNISFEIKALKKRYGRSHTWGIKQYFVCKHCETKHGFLFDH